jgi:hypothetical protein
MSHIHPSYTREIALVGDRRPCVRRRFLSWYHRIAPIAIGVVVVLCGIVALAYAYYGDDRNLSVGYRPEQPIDFSHKQHAGDLGMDCRYCHGSVEESSFAAVPAAEVCFGCHTKVLPNSGKLLRLWESVAKGRAIAWTRVHKIPEHTHFDHSVHLSAGVGCSTCHGRVDKMPMVEQKEPLSMGWCLDCHRDPAPYIRTPRAVTNMDWTSAQAVAAPRALAPPLDCSGCHQ